MNQLSLLFLLVPLVPAAEFPLVDFESGPAPAVRGTAIAASFSDRAQAGRRALALTIDYDQQWSSSVLVPLAGSATAKGLRLWLQGAEVPVQVQVSALLADGGTFSKLVAVSGPAWEEVRIPWGELPFNAHAKVPEAAARALAPAAVSGVQFTVYKGLQGAGASRRILIDSITFY